MKITDLREARGKRRRYDGPPLEAGATSTNFAGMGAAMNSLSKQFPEGAKILDYGAGSYARMSKALREMGFKVYAFDPFNGSPQNDGWSGGAAKKLPRGKFDIGFSAFVLNVVPEYTEKEIIADLSKRAATTYHITRNMDIFGPVKKALLRGDNIITPFFLEQYATRAEKRALETGQLTDDQILAFCQHGTATSKGFQRIPTAEDYGVNLVRNTQGFKLYQA